MAEVKEPVRNSYQYNSEDPRENQNNGGGKEGYDKNQKNIQKLGNTDGTKADEKNPDKDKEKEKFDDQGNVYAWDKDANGGKGAWGAVGKIDLETLKNLKPGEDISDHVKYYDEKDYEKANALNTDGTGDFNDSSNDIKN
jgi:hypothetical protein